MRDIFKIIVWIFAAIGGLVCAVAIVIMFDYYFGDKDKPNVNCDWSETASTWIDENDNGFWDSDEKPLAGVRFIIDDVNSDDFVPLEVVSDKNGIAELFLFPIDCNVNRTKILLYAITPESYKPTTSWRIIVPEDVVARIQSGNFQFGFVKR